MKIAQISLTYKPILGGQEVYIDELQGVMRRAGWEPRVFQRNNGLKDPEISLVSYPKQMRPVMGFNFGLLGQFAKLRTYDRIIVHYPDHFPTVAWHPHSIVLTHGVNWELDGERKRARRVQLASYALRKAKQFVANDTHFYRTMGIEIPPATAFFQEVAPGKWFIPNCVDTNVFTRITPRSEFKKEKIIVVPRNITPARGVDLAVAAFALFAKNHPDSKLLIVGDALPNPESQNYKKTIEHTIKTENLGDRIVFYGSVAHNLMPEIFSSAIMTLIPTRANEGTALSALESMACATPTIVTAVAGLKDLPAQQAEPTAESIAEHMEDVLLHPTLGSEQCAIVRSSFSLDQWAQGWETVIRNG